MLMARKADLPFRATISEINRRSNDIAVPSFILSGAPFFYHSRTKLRTAEKAALRPHVGLRVSRGLCSKADTTLLFA
jgi:hypothetical protein